MSKNKLSKIIHLYRLPSNEYLHGVEFYLLGFFDPISLNFCQLIKN